MPNAQRTTIVTGASQGIGAGLVEAFVNRGYQVVANSRNINKTNPFPRSSYLALVSHDFYEGGRHEMLNELNRDEVRRNLLAWISAVLQAKCRHNI